MTQQERKPLLALVERSRFGEEADFDERFRHERVKRLINGVRNGMSLYSLVRFRFDPARNLTFQGVSVEMTSDPGTLRVIEDIWMRGDYDIPGFIPESGWQVIDIGAHVGIFSMLAASRGARVVSYEPHQHAFEQLRTNTAIWAVDCHRAAVVGELRKIRLFVHPERGTLNSLLPPPPGSAHAGRDGCVEVPAVGIREVLKEPCDLMKLDCEGSEYEIVAHAGPALRNAARILAEIHISVGDCDALVREVRSLGFDVRLHEPLQGVPYRLMTAIRTGA